MKAAEKSSTRARTLTARFFIYSPGLWNAVIVLTIVATEGCISFEMDANVRAASALGMRAFRVDGVEGIRERLTMECLV
jgi:hypothetical protein